MAEINKCPEKVQEILRRDGPSAQDYLAKFIEFLYLRTGFQFDHFRTPRHLQRLLDELSFNRVPLAVWQSLLTAGLRIANGTRRIGHDLRHFGAFCVDVLCWLCNRLCKMKLLKLALFLYAWQFHPLISCVISVIYNIMEHWLGKFCKDLSIFIQSRLISAPYYNHFLTM